MGFAPSPAPSSRAELRRSTSVGQGNETGLERHGQAAWKDVLHSHHLGEHQSSLLDARLVNAGHAQRKIWHTTLP